MNLDFFWKECEMWVDRFGLHEYWWMCDEADETISGGWADVVVDHATMSAHVTIRSDIYDQEHAEKILKRIAFHEVCEVMLTVFRENMSDSAREEARHSVLNKIAHALEV